jgi:hypothetical protein
MHRQTFRHGPSQSGRFDFLFSLHDLICGPHFPGWDLMQGRYNPGCPGLFHFPELDGIVGAEPSPGLFE